MTSLTFSYSSDNPAETLQIFCCSWWFPFVVAVRLVSRSKSISCYLPPKKWKPNVLICQPAFSHRFEHSCEIVSSAVDSKQNAHAAKNKVNCSIFNVTRTHSDAHIYTRGIHQMELLLLQSFSHRTKIVCRWKECVWLCECTNERMNEWMGLVNINNKYERTQVFISNIDVTLCKITII